MSGETTDDESEDEDGDFSAAEEGEWEEGGGGGPPVLELKPSVEDLMSEVSVMSPKSSEFFKLSNQKALLIQSVRDMRLSEGQAVGIDWVKENMHDVVKYQSLIIELITDNNDRMLYHKAREYLIEVEEIDKLLSKHTK